MEAEGLITEFMKTVGGSAGDASGDLAAVCDEYLRKHNPL